MNNRGSKIITGFFLKTIYMALSIVLAFFMMPFILHSLGDKMYGLWILLGTILAYIGYLDMGVSSAVSRFVSRAVGQNDMNEINEISNTTFVIYLFIGLITLVVTLLLVFLAGFLVKSPEDLSIVRILLFVLGLNIAIGFPTRAFGGVLNANLRYEISESIMLTELLLRNLLIFIFFSLGYRIIALGIIVLSTSMLSYALYLFFAFRISRYLKLDIKFFKTKKIGEIFSYSAYTFINRLAGILISRIDALVVTIFIGLSAVAHYSIAAVMVSYLSNFIFNIVGLIGPVFSQDEGRGDMDGVKQKFLFTTKLFVYITVFIGTMMILYGKPFIIRWIGANYVDAYPVLLTLAPCTVIAMMQAPISSVLFNISKQKFLVYVTMAEGIFNLILSIILVKKYGLVGVALGTAIPMILIRFLIQPIYVCHVLKINKVNYYLDTIGICCFKSLLGILPVFWIFSSYVSPSYNILFIFGIIQFIVYGLVIFLWGFGKEERALVFGRITKKLMWKEPLPNII